MLTTVEELVDTGQEMRKDILLLITDDSPLLQTFPPSGWFVPANGFFFPLHITLPQLAQGRLLLTMITVNCEF